jgi:hypothetical protein
MRIADVSLAHPLRVLNPLVDHRSCVATQLGAVESEEHRSGDCYFFHHLARDRHGSRRGHHFQTRLGLGLCDDITTGLLGLVRPASGAPAVPVIIGHRTAGRVGQAACLCNRDGQGHTDSETKGCGNLHQPAYRSVFEHVLSPF